MNFLKLTEYLDSLVNTEAGGCDVSVYQNHKPIYRHMTGYADIEKEIKISEDTI